MAGADTLALVLAAAAQTEGSSTKQAAGASMALARQTGTMMSGSAYAAKWT